MKNYKYLFGPVPSRRLGRSLGVDLTPYKTCSLDCVFCQLGQTTEKTIIRQEYAPTGEVLSELKEWLETGGEADYITLAGSGEPTLHSRFGEILEFIRKNSTIPSVLLTNGTMFNLPEVLDEAACAGVVKVSLSAWDQASFEQVNRPHQDLQFDRLIEGQKAFRSRFTGQLWMEIFLLQGINSTPEAASKIAALIKNIRADRIQLNTTVRPPTEDFAAALPEEDMKELTRLFHPTAEVIADFRVNPANSIRANRKTIFSMLQRRPCTAVQIADIFGMHLNEVSKHLGNLMHTDQISTERKNSTVYYVAKNRKRNSEV